jgi:hypothetical protein
MISFSDYGVLKDEEEITPTPRLAKHQHFLRRIGDGEERRRRFIHPHIGGLRRQHNRNQQAKRIGRVQLGHRRRILLRPGGKNRIHRMGR